MKTIDRILRSYGEKVSVIQNGETFVGDAVIHPMNRRNEAYLGGDRIPTGILDNNRYYMIASSKINLGQTSGGVVECSDKSYYIRSCGDFKVKDKKLYVWAVLSARTEPLEDDYD